MKPKSLATRHPTAWATWSQNVSFTNVVIVEIVPLIRLPRRFAFFDYTVPPTLIVAVGDLVTVPFRGRIIHGVVIAAKNATSEPRLKAVIDLVAKDIIDLDDLKRLHRLAQSYVVSPSTLLSLAVPVIGRPRATITQAILSISSSNIRSQLLPLLNEVRQAWEKQPRSLVIQADKEGAFVIAQLLRKKIVGQVLILFARERDAELFVKKCALPKNSALVHGHTKDDVRSSIAQAWHEGKIGTLIGTRQAALFAATKKLAAIIVIDSGCDDYENTRRNPRFDIREAAQLLAHQHGASIITLDALPRPEDVARADQVVWSKLPVPQVMRYAEKGDKSDLSWISEKLLLEIENTLQNGKKVLLFFNRKGVAKRLQCRACGHIPTCGTCGDVPTPRADDLVCLRCGTEMWYPTICPACGKGKLSLRGLGGAKLESELAQRFGTDNVGRVEKGYAAFPLRPITLATEYFFSGVEEPFTRYGFGLVADLAADLGVHGTTIRAQEIVARRVHRLKEFTARETARCILQATLVEIIDEVLNSEAFILRELGLRKTYQLPPFGIIITLQKVFLTEIPEEIRPRFTLRGELLVARVTEDTFISLQPVLENLPTKTVIIIDRLIT